ncbi:hypothetical protein LHFGNBLO_003708 [Mesorhizobium sp. AR10]|uniref:hypothetical protein n=1 Tax=Mesorhizobium sp. AR10 TaxID=2865839 RepID=UPI00215DF28B|nr:hypothetical protein [Mesorhizobium sp. AR10]UVK36749.1 hypothetical protein LHFGNBLO_003708 [Mesorhizobium sp. AR10]
MLTKILAVSVFTIGLATSAMAQSSGTYQTHRPVSSHEQTMTTGSINAGSDASGLNSLGDTGAVGPCASNTAGPDANAGLNVNDHYCGK